MTLSELKSEVDAAIRRAAECGELPDNIVVSVQIDTVAPSGDFESSVSAVDDLELCYDNDATASGCVIVGIAK
jgi:hypothetical protein